MTKPPTQRARALTWLRAWLEDPDTDKSSRAIHAAALEIQIGKKAVLAAAHELDVVTSSLGPGARWSLPEKKTDVTT